MSAYFAREGYTRLLDALLSDIAGVVGLWGADVNEENVSTVADLGEVSYTGYQRQPLGRWTPSALRKGMAFSDCDVTYFVWPGAFTPVLVRGYFVADALSGKLLWVYRAPGAPLMFGRDNPLLTILIRQWFPAAPLPALGTAPVIQPG